MAERKSLTEELLEINPDKQHIIDVARESARVQLEDPNLSETYKDAVRQVTKEILDTLLPKPE